MLARPSMPMTMLKVDEKANSFLIGLISLPFILEGSASGWNFFYCNFAVEDYMVHLDHCVIHSTALTFAVNGS